MLVPSEKVPRSYIRKTNKINIKYPNKLEKNLNIYELLIILLLVFLLFFIKVFVRTGLIPNEEMEVNKKTKANK